MPSTNAIQPAWQRRQMEVIQRFNDENPGWNLIQSRDLWAELCVGPGQYGRSHTLTAGDIREAHYRTESNTSRTVAHRALHRGANPVKTPKDTQVFWHSKLKSSKTKCYKGLASMLKNNLEVSTSTEHMKVQFKGSIVTCAVIPPRPPPPWTMHSPWLGAQKTKRVVKWLLSTHWRTWNSRLWLETRTWKVRIASAHPWKNHQPLPGQQLTHLAY